MPTPINIVINGASGRMGRRLLAVSATLPNLRVIGALDRADNPFFGLPLKNLIPECDSALMLSDRFPNAADVLIDFSVPEATVRLAEEAAAKKCALVIGTTGLNAEQGERIRAVAQKVPVIHEANYSIGVNLMLKIAAEMAMALGNDFNIEICETHHNRKIDAPSGTALALAHKICNATGRNISHDIVKERDGMIGARSEREIGIQSLRLGSVVGDHTVFFGGEFERLELTHRAQNRDLFAAGALRAAVFVAGKPAGFYSMQDVLGGAN